MPSSSADSRFHTTRWTLERQASADHAEGRAALSELCADYYAPVVAFLRHDGRTEDAAREAAHEFFAVILAKPSLGGAEPGRGRFRSYLLGALKHHQHMKLIISGTLEDPATVDMEMRAMLVALGG